MDVQLGGLCVVPHRCSITSSIRRRARRSLRFAALRLIPRIAAASATLCRWMSQRRNTSRQLRRNCKACISTACITPDGMLGCAIDKRSRRPFTWSGAVILKVDVKLDIPVTGYLFSWRQIDEDRRHALLLGSLANVPTDAEAVKNGSGEAVRTTALPPAAIVLHRDAGNPAKRFAPWADPRTTIGAHQLWWSRSDAHCHGASRANFVSI
jgi:hypothetical protein